MQVSPAYIHIEKATHYHGVIPSTNSRLKWYDIARSDLPIERSIRNLAHDFVARQTTSVGIPSAQELGFV
ncbi:MAG: hypothetical protein AB8B96_19950 [Lysobacterales bacterium]